MFKKFIFSLVALDLFSSTEAQMTTNIQAKMEWFDDAKLGMFIHWGLYSVDGISESYAFLIPVSRMKITCSNWMASQSKLINLRNGYL